MLTRTALLQSVFGFIQYEMISSICKHSLIAHTAQLLGQGAAIEIEVVCELLAVEGNIELIPALPCSLAGKISQQPAAHIFGRCTENTGRQRQIFLRGKQKNALHQLAVPAFSCIVSVKQGEQAEKRISQSFAATASTISASPQSA